MLQPLFLPFGACLAVFYRFVLIVTPKREKTRSKRLFLCLGIM